jgi:hypothetical protein
MWFLLSFVGSHTWVLGTWWMSWLFGYHGQSVDGYIDKMENNNDTHCQWVIGNLITRKEAKAKYP